MSDAPPTAAAPPSPGEGHDLRPPKVADSSQLIEVAPSVWVLPDIERIPHVPNVGIIVGERSALVVDAGFGTANGRRVLSAARELAGERRLFLVTTHFHPEHLLGALAFRGEAVIVGNAAQVPETREKGRWFIDTFSGQTPARAAALAGAEYVAPDVTYDGPSCRLELGDREVVIMHRPFGHTRSDQVVFVPDAGVLFAGDLVEQAFFWVMPDADANAEVWEGHLWEMENLDPVVVVPGHGAIGGRELITEVRESLAQLRGRVTELYERELAFEEILSIVESEMIAAYPTWENREFIARAIRNTYDWLCELSPDGDA
jgi:glyoxylase-like metal-dependent hydrolase (beta-lactamase superfamily II)